MATTLDYIGFYLNDRWTQSKTLWFCFQMTMRKTRIPHQYTHLYYVKKYRRFVEVRVARLREITIPLIRTKINKIRKKYTIYNIKKGIRAYYMFWRL